MFKKLCFLNTSWVSCIKKAIFCICLFSLNAWSLSFISSAAPEASHILKNTAGTLKNLVCYNTSASSQFILIFNSATVPADSTVPVVAPMTCPGSANCTYDMSTLQGIPLSTGIVWTNSSTASTKTIGGSTVMCTGAVQ